MHELHLIAIAALCTAVQVSDTTKLTAAHLPVTKSLHDLL